MWTVDQKDFLLLRNDGGQPFKGFVNVRIRAHGLVRNVNSSRLIERGEFRKGIAEIREGRNACDVSARLAGTPLCI